MLKNNFKIAIRNFTKRKVYSIVNVIGLSIAISTSLLVYTFVKSELTYDQFNTLHESIYRLNIKSKRGENWREGGAVAPVMAPELASNSTEIRNYVRIKTAVSLVKFSDVYSEELFHYADPSLFNIFTLPLLAGNSSLFSNSPNVAIITEEYALKHFNTLDVIGQLVEVELQEKFQPFEIVGVAKDIPNNSSVEFNLLLPFQKFEEVAEGDWMTSWRAWGVTTFFLMKDQFSKESFEDQITTLSREHFPEEQRQSVALTLQPLDDLYLNENVRGISPRGSIDASITLMAIALFILIIACINFTNLMIGMAVPRLKEVAIKKVVGASQLSLITQFIVEAFITTTMSFMVAVLLTDLLMPVFSDLTNTALVFLPGFTPDFLLFSAVLILTITLLSGLYPAIYIAKFNPVESFKDSKITSKNYLFKVLVVLQFSIAVFFATSVGTIFQQVQYMYTADKGYDDSNIMTVNIRDLDGDLVVARMKNQLDNSTSVASVSASSSYGARLNYNEETYRIQQSRVEPGYFNALDIDLVSGRFFYNEGDFDSHNSIIVNEKLLAQLSIPLEEAIGHSIPFNNYEGMVNPRIIGVIGDVKLESLERDVAPRIFHVHPDLGFKKLLIKYNQSQSANAQEAIQNVWKSIFDVRPLEVEYLTEINKKQYASLESEKSVIVYAGIISILISCLGLFALSSLKIQQRTKEVGIRKVLGASIPRLILTLTSNISQLLFISTLIALPISWYASMSWLDNFAYQVTLNYLPFIGIILIVLIVAYLSISYQLFRTARVNPAKSLRSE